MEHQHSFLPPGVHTQGFYHSGIDMGLASHTQGGFTTWGNDMGFATRDTHWGLKTWVSSHGAHSPFTWDIQMGFTFWENKMGFATWGTYRGFTT